MSTVYLIDASPYIFRAYYSLPPTIKSPDGMQVNAVYGYTDFLLQILKESPTHIAVAFDGSLTTSFRNKIYPEYKAQRELPPPELEAQLDTCFKVTQAMGMSAFIDDEFEADDIIGTLLDQLSGKNRRAVVVSNDKDFAQFVSDKVTFWNFAKGERYDSTAVEKKFGVPPGQIVDLLALMGDSVDNIPGVKGVGPKTAKILLNHFGGLEQIYENIDVVESLPLRGAASVREKLIQHREMAELSKQLATISLDAPLQADLNKLKYAGAEREKIEPLFRNLGFTNLKDRIPLWA
ncbi:MAG: exodeoxyribonuclease IX [Caldithrix sp.]|nr:MAG: exodeoxyribonuclease IX [Caldithrix sp.]